jgi:hypothetical protein
MRFLSLTCANIHFTNVGEYKNEEFDFLLTTLSLFRLHLFLYRPQKLVCMLRANDVDQAVAID